MNGAKPAPQPFAFLTYVRKDNEHDYGRLSEMFRRLSGEVEMQTGKPFSIIQDVNEIEWGEHWPQWIHDSVNTASLIIPIITPSFFESKTCRMELSRFVEHERELGRNDLILPVYYVSTAVLDDPVRRAEDSLAVLIFDRQYFDWRDLRFEPMTSRLVSVSLAKMAVQIRETLGRPHRLGGEQPYHNAVADSVIQQRPEQSDRSLDRPISETVTRTVDAHGSADFATIADAVRGADAGERILVRPGTYVEPLVIDKPLEIYGATGVNDAVIEVAGEDAVLFNAGMGRIGNLTIVQTGGNGAAVNIANGRLQLENCVITSRSLTCVMVHNAADPQLRGNRIHGGNQAGVYVYDRGRGTLENNFIQDHGLNGVEIASGGNPTLRNNHICGCRHAGVYVYDNGEGTLEDNDIYNHLTNGVVIQSGANPTLRRNRIYNCSDSGVYVFLSGRGTIDGNEIFGNSCGVAIERRGNARVAENRIHANKFSGIHVFNNGQAPIEENDIFDNGRNGVEIATRSSCQLARNHIFDCGHAGVYVHDRSDVKLEDNQIERNRRSGIVVDNGATAIIRKNSVTDNHHHGVFVRDGSVVVEDNDLRANGSISLFVHEASAQRVQSLGNKL